MSENILAKLPAVAIMLRDRTVDVSDIIINARKQRPRYEIQSGGNTLELTCRKQIADKVYDDTFSCVMYEYKYPYRTKRAIRIKTNGVEFGGNVARALESVGIK